ncbi:hypothetical protein NIIDMKKI_64980 [Mycobacterium kansasii]|uniref:Cation/H+ exchanger transmembrane domain-containing protein n=1 Tax=Mycobacterium kansasii TaxID=1768 RepID=A0A7G1IMM5_MYCKA|nr:hypothetical protein NIIDMKKI_64980 [Mycobacterium kansasii]
MTLILAFGVVLLISVSLSGVAARTVLSSALMFLVAGAVLGPGILAWDKIGPNDPLVATLADVALFTVLFTDGQRANLQELRENWSLSGRALGMGMPLTMIGIAVPAHFLAGLNWPTAFLVGAILSPTDPVFAAAIVGRSDIPQRLRRLLNVESGLNDGLALPFVMIFLATAQGAGSELVKVGIELVLGLALGVGVAAGAALAWRTKILTAEPHLQPLGPLAIAVVVYAGCHLMHANPYLAAFAAGSTLATLDHVAAEEFQRFGDLLSEVTKFAALIVFGALLTPVAIGIELARLGFRGDRHRGDPAGRNVAVACADPPHQTRATDRGVVRAERLRLRGLRAAGATDGDSRQRAGFRCRRRHHCPVDRAALVDRCADSQNVARRTTRRVAGLPPAGPNRRKVGGDRTLKRSGLAPRRLHPRKPILGKS